MGVQCSPVVFLHACGQRNGGVSVRFIPRRQPVPECKKKFCMSWHINGRFDSLERTRKFENPSVKPAFVGIGIEESQQHLPHSVSFDLWFLPESSSNSSCSNLSSFFVSSLLLVRVSKAMLSFFLHPIQLTPCFMRAAHALTSGENTERISL